MKTSEIPLTPVPLTSEQAEAMLQRQIKKHHVAIMLLHWWNAFVWLFGLITGLALISSPLFRVVPEWYISIVEGVFGSRANMLQSTSPSASPGSPSSWCTASSGSGPTSRRRS